MDAGGDGLLMACLWKAGYAVTDPGFSFYHPELRMFDPVSQEGRQLLYAFTEGLSGGCDASCQVPPLLSLGYRGGGEGLTALMILETRGGAAGGSTALLLY